MSDPQISIVIPSKNSAHCLDQVLRAALNSTGPTKEIIVVDDASTDHTAAIVSKYPVRYIRNNTNIGCAASRNVGFDKACGDILVNIDSDVVVPEQMLEVTWRYFQDNPHVGALTAILSTTHPNNDFFSQYKNLYMNYIFNKQSQEITFLYGSYHAIRRKYFVGYDASLRFIEDADIAQRIRAKGGVIHLIKEPQVVHLKKYSFGSWLSNDYRIPYCWAYHFIETQKWKDLLRHKTGYLHASKTQLASLILAGLTLTIGFLCLFWPDLLSLTFITVSLWGMLNLEFVKFLGRHRGVRFACLAYVATFLDHCVMLLAVMCGMCRALLVERK